MIRSIVVGTVALAGAALLQLPGDADEYYPTGPGDSWTYESSVRGTFTNQVVHAEESEGAADVRMVSTDAAGREQVLVIRKEGSQLALGPNSESLALLADFGLEVGASVHASAPASAASGGATVTLAGRHDALEVFGTRFDDVVQIRVTQPSGAISTYYFARGIGMVGMESASPDVQVRLVRATVGGRAVVEAGP